MAGNTDKALAAIRHEGSGEAVGGRWTATAIKTAIAKAGEFADDCRNSDCQRLDVPFGDDKEDEEKYGIPDKPFDQVVHFYRRLAVSTR